MLQARLFGLSGSDAATRAQELLELVELTDAADRRFKGYSGGMKRRLDLASAQGWSRSGLLDRATSVQQANGNDAIDQCVAARTEHAPPKSAVNRNDVVQPRQLDINVLSYPAENHQRKRIEPAFPAGEAGRAPACTNRADVWVYVRTAPPNPTKYPTGINVGRFVMFYEELHANEHARSSPR